MTGDGREPKLCLAQRRRAGRDRADRPGAVGGCVADHARLGFDAKLRRYFDLHAVLDIKHSEEWNKEAIRPARRGRGRRSGARHVRWPKAR
jgi:hypothetical protein